MAGSLPNLTKVKPVIDALDAGTSEVFFIEFGPARPDGAGWGSDAAQAARIMIALEPLVGVERPQVVVVGDVDSTLAFALVAAKAGALHARGGQPNGDR